ncbi:hypothetical protein BJ912DRAFT_1047684, partial [Pholiota molesta]
MAADNDVPRTTHPHSPDSSTHPPSALNTIALNGAAHTHSDGSTAPRHTPYQHTSHRKFDPDAYLVPPVPRDIHPGRRQSGIRSHPATVHGVGKSRHPLIGRTTLRNAPAAPPEWLLDTTSGTGWSGERNDDEGEHETSDCTQRLRLRAREGGPRAPRRAGATQHRQRRSQVCRSHRICRPLSIALTEANRRRSDDTTITENGPHEYGLRGAVSNETTALGRGLRRGLDDANGSTRKARGGQL